MANGPFAVAVFKQLVQVSPPARVKAKGELMIAEEMAPVPLPASIPPKVVDPVPPTFTVRVEEEVMALEPLPMRGCPAVVLVAVRLPATSVPETRALPWTLKLVAGEVVDIPKKFAAVKTEVSAPEVLYMSIIFAVWLVTGAKASVVVAAETELTESLA